MSDQATQMGLQKSRRIHSQVPRKALYGELKPHLGEVFHRLARQKESRIEQGHLMPDHVHMMISIPPKYAVSQVVGYIKGKSAILLARTKALSLLMVDDRRRMTVPSLSGFPLLLGAAWSWPWSCDKWGVRRQGVCSLGQREQTEPTLDLRVKVKISLNCLFSIVLATSHQHARPEGSRLGAQIAVRSEGEQVIWHETCFESACSPSSRSKGPDLIHHALTGPRVGATSWPSLPIDLAMKSKEVNDNV
jgi:REP element-mobilizing transposase RayT